MKNAMNLRSVTIWTTGVMMVLPIVAPVGGSYFAYLDGMNNDVNIVFGFTVGILHFIFGCPPFVISFVLAKKLKNNVSAGIILISTIAWGVWYVVYWWEGASWSASTLVVVFFGATILSLPVMLPAWITALILNWHYRIT